MTRTLDRAVQGPAACQNPVDWDLEADVVVVGAGATGLPAAIVAREAGCSVILVEAEQGYRRPCHHQRRQCPARWRHQRPEEIRHRGYAGPAVPRSDRLVGRRSRTAFPITVTTTARSSAPLPTTAPPCFEWLLAHGVEFVDRAPDRSAVIRSAIRCRARCTASSDIGRCRRPAARPTGSAKDPFVR